MIQLKQQLKKIDDQRKLYRILLNKSRFRQELESDIWLMAADLTSRFDAKQTVDVQTDQAKTVKGLFEAFEIVRQADKTQLSIPFVIDTHAQALAFENPNATGCLRSLRARWLDSTMILANPTKVPYLLDRLVDGVNMGCVPAFYWDECPDPHFQKYARHPIMQAIETNYNTIAIHPFSDGNKRIARLISAWILDKYGHIPLSIYNRMDYISSIENYFNTRRPHMLYELMFEQMRQSYDSAICEVRASDKIWIHKPFSKNGISAKQPSR